jgi:poly(A) polymerase
MPARQHAITVVKTLVDAGHLAYFAGGWVRDMLLNRPSDDIDIATSASVDEVQALFPKTIPVGVAFGIVIVVVEGHQFEVATFRKDRGYVDGRRPTGIEPAAPIEDAQRRDFTINGMFYDPLKEELHDYVGGQEDLKRGIIRAIGDPHERFLEDRLRMMRAVRYSTRFDFPIDPETTQAICAHASTLLPAVAMERIWQEFKKMSHFAHFDTGLIMLHKLQLLPTIFPALNGVSVEEIEKRLQPLKFYPKNPPTIAELLELFPGYALDDLISLCDYLKLSKQEREYVAYFHRIKGMLEMPEEWQKNLEKMEWVHLYAHPQAALTLDMIVARFSDDKRSRILSDHTQQRLVLSNFIERIIEQNPVVRSEHLKALGVLPGKKMGLLLREAERIACNIGSENSDEVIAHLKNSPLWSE